MLYMPALVATRYNRQLGQTYQTLCSAGKPAKLAITAVMRKLLILANALVPQRPELGRNSLSTETDNF